MVSIPANEASSVRRGLVVSPPMEDGVVLRNRLAVATNVWRDHVREPLPKLSPGTPQEQIQTFEIKLVERLAEQATPANASEVAERTWDLVHDRPENDPVKVRVVDLHAGPPSNF